MTFFFSAQALQWLSRIWFLCSDPLTLSPTTLLLAHPSPDIPASLLYFKSTKHNPAPGPLHMLFLLSGSRCLLLFHPLHSELCSNVISLKRPSLTTPYNEVTFMTLFPCLVLFFFIKCITSWHHILPCLFIYCLPPSLKCKHHESTLILFITLSSTPGPVPGTPNWRSIICVQ